MRRLEYQARYGLRAPLRAYQRRAVARAIGTHHFAFLMEPRLGKTRCAVAVAGYRFLADNARRWIVFCPKIAQSVWKEEIEKSLAIPHSVLVVEGKADERKATLQTSFDPDELTVWLLNHEASWRLKKILYKMNPDIVTIDESHRIKNHASKQSKSLGVLGRRARFRNILTGTFISTPLDVFAQMRFLDPTVFGEKFEDFKNRFVKSYGFGGFKPKTYKNLDQMMEAVRPMAFELTREAAGGFPAVDVSNVYFELTNPTKRHYREMEAEFRTKVQHEEVEATIILTQALRLQQITGGFLPVEDGVAEIGRDRIKTALELIDGYPRDYPLVILALFTYELEALERALKPLGRPCSVIRGGVDQTAARLAFQQGRVNTCLVQLRAGIAIDLSRANTAIFYSLNSSLIDYEQAKSRIIAAGQSSVSLIHIVAKDTVDEVIHSSVQEKRNVAESLTRFLQ